MIVYRVTQITTVQWYCLLCKSQVAVYCIHGK